MSPGIVSCREATGLYHAQISLLCPIVSQLQMGLMLGLSRQHSVPVKDEASLSGMRCSDLAFGESDFSESSSRT